MWNSGTESKARKLIESENVVYVNAGYHHVK